MLNCPICNITRSYENKYNLERAKRNNSPCKSCTCIIRNSTREYTKRDKNSQWKGYECIPYNWFSSYFERRSKNKSKRNGTITIKDAYELWIKQDKKCALSNINIGFYDDGEKHTCSIDRIDSSKEYDIDNIQLVHKDINLMKNHFNQDYFIQMCKLIANKQ